MGGQVDYFGLWISSEYGRGHSMARPKCSTFGSPCLSGKEEFQVEVLEAWGVGQPRLPDSDDEVSILVHVQVCVCTSIIEIYLVLLTKPSHFLLVV